MSSEMDLGVKLQQLKVQVYVLNIFTLCAYFRIFMFPTFFPILGQCVSLFRHLQVLVLEVSCFTTVYIQQII